MNKQMNKLAVLVLLLLTTPASTANQADVINVKASQADDKTWRFDVTLKHDDEGWDHYANQWVITDLDNKILATRTLYHPHVHEQPFTRNIQGVKIPDSITRVKIIARDSVHQRTGKVVEYDLKELKIIETKEGAKEGAKDGDKEGAKDGDKDGDKDKTKKERNKR